MIGILTRRRPECKPLLGSCKDLVAVIICYCVGAVRPATCRLMRQRRSYKNSGSRINCSARGWSRCRSDRFGGANAGRLSSFLLLATPPCADRRGECHRLVPMARRTIGRRYENTGGCCLPRLARVPHGAIVRSKCAPECHDIRLPTWRSSWTACSAVGLTRRSCSPRRFANPGNSMLLIVRCTMRCRILQYAGKAPDWEPRFTRTAASRLADCRISPPKMATVSGVDTATPSG